MRLLPPCEVAWFGALCDDDYEQLGVPDARLRSSWTHCAAIVEEAERQGFDSVLMPSGYALGLDTTVMAAALAVRTSSIRLLMAVRMAETWPPALARQLATLQHLAGGRLDVNVISSDLAGAELAGPSRYARTLEVLTILEDLLAGRSTRLAGEFFDLEVDPPRIATGPRPTVYFGGLSEAAREVAASAADVYLMWPDVEDVVAGTVRDLRARAAVHGRSLRFGYRVHVVVRDTEREARNAAAWLVAGLDDAEGRAIRALSLIHI